MYSSILLGADGLVRILFPSWRRHDILIFEMKPLWVGEAWYRAKGKRRSVRVVPSELFRAADSDQPSTRRLRTVFAATAPSTRFMGNAGPGSHFRFGEISSCPRISIGPYSRIRAEIASMVAATCT